MQFLNEHCTSEEESLQHDPGRVGRETRRETGREEGRGHGRAGAALGPFPSRHVGRPVLTRRGTNPALASAEPQPGHSSTLLPSLLGCSHPQHPPASVSSPDCPTATGKRFHILLARLLQCH